MATLDIGKIRFTARGAYNAGTVYSFLDVVRFENSSYVYVNAVATSGNAPPSAQGASNTYWELLAGGLLPLTSDGDLVTRIAGVVARLPIGVGGEFLTVAANGVPAWTKPPGRAGQVVTKLQRNNNNNNNNNIFTTIRSRTAAAIMSDGGIRIWGDGTAMISGNAVAATVANPTPLAFDSTTGVEPVLPFQQVITYGNSGYALDASGNVWSWGGNVNGELGHGDTTNRPVAKRIEFFVSAGIQIQSIVLPQGLAEVGASAFFITTTGLLYAVGKNNYGQLGDGSTTNRSTPIRCGTLAGVVGVACSDSGAGSVFAWNATGALWSWGRNLNGQLGAGNTTDRSTPQSVSGLPTSPVIGVYFGVDEGAIAVRVTTTFVLFGNGTLFACGDNQSGQIGVGDTTARTAFVQVGSGTNWKAFSVTGSAIAAHCAAIDSADKLWTWGNNASGQLGLGDVTVRSAPVLNATIPSALGVVCARNGTTVATYVITLANQLWAAGNNVDGNLAFGNALATINNTFRRMNWVRQFINSPVAEFNVMVWFGASATALGQVIIAEDSAGRVYHAGRSDGGLAGTGTTTVYPAAKDFFSEILM